MIVRAMVGLAVTAVYGAALIYSLVTGRTLVFHIITGVIDRRTEPRLYWFATAVYAAGFGMLLGLSISGVIDGLHGAP